MSSILGQYTPAHLDKSPWMFGSTKVGGRRKGGKSRRRNKSVKNITRKRRPRIYNKQKVKQTETKQIDQTI